MRRPKLLKAICTHPVYGSTYKVLRVYEYEIYYLDIPINSDASDTKFPVYKKERFIIVYNKEHTRRFHWPRFKHHFAPLV